MKRRTFLRKAIAATGAATLVSRAGPFVHADDKAGSKNPVIGQGEHRYECIHGWGELPDGFAWQTTHGVAVDEAGFVYITQQGHTGKPAIDTIVVFDPKGKFVRSFGKRYFSGGHGIDIRKEGGEEFLYLTNTWRRTFSKTNLKGEVVWTKAFPDAPNKYTEAEQFSPTNIAFAPDGGFYVADGYGSHLIHQYDKAAKWVRTWGGAGKEPGQMQTPHGIWLDNRPGREPSLVVADRANARLQYFTLDGKFLSLLENAVFFPAHFDIRGDVLLVPDLHARVSLFDKNNKPVVHLGEDPEWRKTVVDSLGQGKTPVRTRPQDWQAGKFVHPHDACFDNDGNIFVVEWVATGRVTLLKHVS